ncbi:MAG: orotate phosphoribosyltransferase [Egibacteraceae bacterium]
MGLRLRHLVERADLIVAMGGGVGSLHELTAALWYAGNVRAVPVVLLGRTADRLQAFLRRDRWLYESPTRPLDFLHSVRTGSELAALLADLAKTIHAARPQVDPSLTERVRRAACVEGHYQLASGEVLSAHFDPFRLAGDPALSADLARAMAGLVAAEVDVVAGIAVGGLVLAANLAAELGLPLLVARPAPKRYGAFAEVEGVVRPGQRVLLVDDVVRSGQQMVSAAGALFAAGLVVRDALCVLERSGTGRTRLLEHGITMTSVTVEADDSTLSSAAGVTEAVGDATC